MILTLTHGTRQGATLRQTLELSTQTGFCVAFNATRRHLCAEVNRASARHSKS